MHGVVVCWYRNVKVVKVDTAVGRRRHQTFQLPRVPGSAAAAAKAVMPMDKSTRFWANSNNSSNNIKDTNDNKGGYHLNPQVRICSVCMIAFPLRL